MEYIDFLVTSQSNPLSKLHAYGTVVWSRPPPCSIVKRMLHRYASVVYLTWLANRSVSMYYQLIRAGYVIYATDSSRLL